jgi:hypothetical protein
VFVTDFNRGWATKFKLSQSIVLLEQVMTTANRPLHITLAILRFYSWCSKD